MLNNVCIIIVIVGVIVIIVTAITIIAESTIGLADFAFVYEAASVGIRGNSLSVGKTLATLT